MQSRYRSMYGGLRLCPRSATTAAVPERRARIPALFLAVAASFAFLPPSLARAVPRAAYSYSDAIDWLGSAMETTKHQRRLPLCMEGPGDIGRVVTGAIQYGPAPVGEPFPQSVMEDFPYASHEHCHTYTEALHLVPRNCRLQVFDPAVLLRQIEGRRLVFWGDSVMRQFFAYTVLRLTAHQVEAGFDLKGNYDDHPPADPSICHYNKTAGKSGLQLDKACFGISSNAFRDQQSCFYYLDGSTALCYVKLTSAVVDDKNVVFWNELKETDIMFANFGLHHNRRSDFRNALVAFASLLKYESARRPLPLILWRDSSAQHFQGGEGGNFPLHHHSHLRDVDPHTFQCTQHSPEIMKAADWRNRYLSDMGFVTHNVRVDIPIMRIWQVTSGAYWLHPRSHGTKTEHAVADCTHFCPNFGGMYEIWTTLLQNTLTAAQPLSATLRPQIARSEHPLHHYSKLLESIDKEAAGFMKGFAGG